MQLIAIIAVVLALTAPASADSRPLLAPAQATINVQGEEREVALPSGYRLEVLTEALQTPRLLTFAPDGDLFIGSKDDRVFRLKPPYRAPEVFAEIKGYPHSVAFRSGEILIATTEALYRAPYSAGRAPLKRDELSLLAELPNGGGGHSSRTVRVGPDGRVYIGLGIAGNCSNQYVGKAYPFQDRRGGVLVLDESGPKPTLRPFALGLRNPVGFAWHPGTGVLYASNNGPDHWGFELPPEYFSELAPDSFHGMPWFQFDGERVRRDDCIEIGSPRPATDVRLPPVTFPARSAPMDVAFVPKGALDPRLEGDAIVALHGSWATRPYGWAVGNPASKREPKLVRVRFEDGQARGVEDLISGFQETGGDRWARPVGVAVGPDGGLYFTSDAGANALFRLGRDAD